jgi:hypothetical protein
MRIAQMQQQQVQQQQLDVQKAQINNNFVKSVVGDNFNKEEKNPQAAPGSLYNTIDIIITVINSNQV